MVDLEQVIEVSRLFRAEFVEVAGIEGLTEEGDYRGYQHVGIPRRGKFIQRGRGRPLAPGVTEDDVGMDRATELARAGTPAPAGHPRPAGVAAMTRRAG